MIASTTTTTTTTTTTFNEKNAKEWFIIGFTIATDVHLALVLVDLSSVTTILINNHTFTANFKRTML